MILKYDNDDDNDGKYILVYNSNSACRYGFICVCDDHQANRLRPNAEYAYMLTFQA